MLQGGQGSECMSPRVSDLGRGGLAADAAWAARSAPDPTELGAPHSHPHPTHPIYQHCGLLPLSPAALPGLQPPSRPTGLARLRGAPRRAPPPRTWPWTSWSSWPGGRARWAQEGGGGAGGGSTGRLGSRCAAGRALSPARAQQRGGVSLGHQQGGRLAGHSSSGSRCSRKMAYEWAAPQ